MASRQLRKLRKQQELLNLQNEAPEKSEESDDERIVAKPRPNMFSGFAALGDMGDGGDDDDEDQKSTDNEAPAPQRPSAREEPAKKSKKSKKKKKKGKQTESHAPAGEEPESLDDIDRVLEELKLAGQRQGGSATVTPAASQAASDLNELLRINFQHLKAMNEMRRLFGKAIDVAEVEERTQESRQRALPQNIDLETFLSARAAHPGQGPQGNKGMFDTILRTNPFIEGKKTWPRGSAQGLKMIRVTGEAKEEVEFAFAHDKSYDALEGSFFGLVQMYDPMQIVYFLHRYPYHISSLIQVSKVARQDQNSALAADLIERALFTFGRATLSEFRKKLESGTARMDFARPENRQFYLAGYNLVQKLVLKATYRTALEWAKLFLSINHHDPYAMINWIHVLAIRAREAQWFIDFCNSSLFDTPQPTAHIYIQQTLPLAHLQLQDLPAAKSNLIKGMETVPWLYCALFSALNLDTPKSLWAIQPRDQDEELHVQLYLHTAKELWNMPQAISLLKEAAAAADVPRASDLPAGPPVSLATARFVYLDNTPALMAAVPRTMLHASPNFDFDPLPPPRAENVFSSDTQQLPWRTTENEASASARLRRAVESRGDDEAMQAAARRLLRQWRRERGDALLARGGAAGEGEDPEMAEEINELMRRLAEGREEGGPGGSGDQEGDDELLGQRGEEEGGENRRAEPGLFNFLFSVMRRTAWTPEGREPPTGEAMPGGWDDEYEDDWGEVEFEGADDFGDGQGGNDTGGERPPGR
ncbi:Ribosome quality control complex subunit 1 [Madurella mycetomatis]|uniref:Ribosome quality control complex subunit 1 n=1 Tax=Madurella mycetomatis TaxID=100816 RepID=A0A175WFD7_9PEZI|nr:Ribosome quality control complex subunit 1 [Madurella mycetomatis]